MISFTVEDWSVWSPEKDQTGPLTDQYIAKAFGDRETVPPVKDIPMMVRRRLTRLGKMAMRVAHDIEGGADARLVFSSRYGEVASTEKLLDELSHDQPLSPTSFSTSVHNGLAGLLTILQNNPHPHTAIAAREESFCMALVEAGALLAENPEIPVMLVHYDEPLTEFYETGKNRPVPSMALAMLLRASGESDVPLQLGFSVIDGDASDDPTDAAITFIDFIAGKTDRWEWRCQGRDWWCRRHDG